MRVDLEFLPWTMVPDLATALEKANEPDDAMGRQRHEIAYELVGDIDRYNDLLDASKRRISAAVDASATSLTSMCGIGPITAAVIIGQSNIVGRPMALELLAAGEHFGKIGVHVG